MYTTHTHIYIYIKHTEYIYIHTYIYTYIHRYNIVNFYQIEYFSSKKYFFLLELNAFLADRMLSQIEYSKDPGENHPKTCILPGDLN